LILHPNVRTTWLKEKWPAERADTAIWSAKKLWERYRDRLPLSSYEEGLRASSLQQRNQDKQKQKQKQKQKKEFSNPFQQIKEQRFTTTRPRSQDEYEDYCLEAPYEPGLPCLQWWLDPHQRTRWPRLSALAIEILSIPPMSDEPERVFSDGRRTVSWDRASLHINTLEMLECQKNWRKRVLPEIIRNL
jgi:hypothetical protein